MAAPMEAEVPGTHPVRIRDLSLSAGGDPLLNQVTFSIQRHTLVGIIGESGAGKSTLMRLLARRLDVTSVTGTGAGWLPSNVWLIAQENVLYEYDTPIDVLVFVHTLRVPEASAAEHAAAATNALEQVNFPMPLANRCIGPTDGGLGVGARRLLNVASALLAQPDVILLDEPTTGLDPPTAHLVVSTLQKLCDAKLCTAVCTIHQPSARTFQCFHDVLVMHKGAALAPDRLARQRGDAVGPAARLLNLAATGGLRPSAAHFAAVGPGGVEHQLLDDATTAQLPNLTPASVGVATELHLLLWRNATRSWNNLFAFRFRVAMALALAVMLGVTFIQMAYDDARFLRDHMGFYLAANGITFVPIIVAAGFFPGEKPTFVHEFSQSLRVRLPLYMVARTVFDMAFAVALSPTVFIIGAMVGIPRGWGTFWCTLVLQTWVADALGFALSTVIGPAVAIAAAIPAIGFMSMMLGSAVLSPPDGGAGWIFDVCKWGSFFKYGFTSLATEHLDYMSGACTPGVDGCAFPNAAAMRAFLQLSDTSVFHNTVGFQLMMLGLMFAALRVAAGLLLWLTLRRSRISYQRSAAAPGARAPWVREPFRCHPVMCIARERLDVGDRVLFEFTHGPAMHSGELVGIVGPAQSGKSLLLQLIARQTPIENHPDSAVELFFESEIDPQNPAARGRRAMLRTPSAARLVYPHDDFPHGATVGELLAYNMRVRAMRAGCPLPSFDDISGEATALLAEFGLGHIPMSRLCGSMSGGQQRRLSVACQLLHRTPLLLLDEPTSGLDSEVAVLIMSALRRHAQRWNVLVLCALQQPDTRVAELLSLVLVTGADDACRRASQKLKTFPTRPSRQPSVCYPTGFTSCDRSAFEHCSFVEPRRPPPGDDENGCTRRVTFAGTVAEARRCPAAREVIEFSDEDDDDDNGGAVPPGSLAAQTTGEPFHADPTNVGNNSSRFDWLALQPLCQAAAPTVFDVDDVDITCSEDVGARRASEMAALGFGIVVRRMFAARVATPLFYAAELFLKFVFMPLLMSAIVPQVDDPTYSNRIGVLFGIVGSLLFTGLVAPTVTASLEFAVRQRELRSGDYGAVTYAVARWLVELPLDALGTTVGTALAYGIVGFKMDYGVLWAAMFCAYQAAVPLGTAIGALPQPLPVTAGLAAFTTVLFMLTSAVIVTPFQVRRTVVLRAVEVVVPSRHAVVVMLDAELRGEPPAVQRSVKAGFGFDRWLDDVGTAWGLLLMTVVLYRLVAIAVVAFMAWWGRRGAARMQHRPRTAQEKYSAHFAPGGVLAVLAEDEE